MRTNPSSAEIIEYFSAWDLDNESRQYIQAHAWRYQFLLEKIDELIVNNRIKKILDIGCAYQTELMRQIYPNITIDTIGFSDNRFVMRHQDKHIEYDLNQTQTKKYPPLQPYDLVVMAEVIEHLYTAPTLVFDWLNLVVNPDGFIIVQTPNAVGLSKRIKMLVGRHPYEMLREDMANPGHYREYTLPELIHLGKGKKLLTVSAFINNDFRSHTISNNFFNFISPVLPASLRRGITIIYKKI